MRIPLLLSVITLHLSSSAIVRREFMGYSKTEPTWAERTFKAIAEDATGNVIFSPDCLFQAIHLLFMSSTGETNSQYYSASVKLYQNVDQRNATFWNDNSHENEEFELYWENKIFKTQNFSFKLGFQLFMSLDRLEAQNVDIDKSKEIGNPINDWTENRATYVMTEFVDKTDVKRTPALVFLSSVRFKGDWAHKFNKKETAIRPFYVDDKTIKGVPTMRRIGDYQYGELPELNSTFIELPYMVNWMIEKNPVSMFIILPNEINGLSELIRNFEKFTLQKLHQGEKRKVEVFLPKFQIENTIDLAPSLNKLNLESGLTDSANFSITNEKSLKIGKIVQKNVLNVDEQGTQATSITGSHEESKGPHDVSFIADHPFVSLIVTDYANPIYSVVVVDPSPESE